MKSTIIRIRLRILAISILLLPGAGFAQLLSDADMVYLEDLTLAVIDSSRVLPGADLPPGIRDFGPNNTGTILIRPGGRDCYPSFWIRDYAMSIETGMIPLEEQLQMLLFTAARQADQSWITGGGSLVPVGAIPDHIRFTDGLPVYYPGTYSYTAQGSPMWRIPPYCDQFYFIHMAWCYVTTGSDPAVLSQLVNNRSLIDRLMLAYGMVPENPATGMVTISPDFQTCDFGFRDVIGMTGDICFGSLLKFQAAMEMSELLAMTGEEDRAEFYRKAADKIRMGMMPVFGLQGGMVRASTGVGSQPDVWATAYAVYLGILDKGPAREASEALSKGYRDGVLAMEGQIRHVMTTDNFSETTMWEKSAVPINSYQNGAYWATPTGWVCFAMAITDPESARQLAAEYVENLRKTDFRLGPEFGGPYECVFPPTDAKQNAVYMTSVTCPLVAFRKMGR